jgi:pyruvate dehydrogenase E2 component (dihydrolipoyllysine-residue acetyltransferase)
MIHTVIMPDLGQTVAEGKIVRWLKKPGDNVSKGEALLEVETDKVTMEVESYIAGYLRAVLINEGEMASAMSPIALLTDRPDEAYENEGYVERATGDTVTAETFPHSAPPPPNTYPCRVTSPASSPAAVANGLTRVTATPAARSRAHESGLDLRRVVPSRPDGLITRRDVDSALAREAPSRPTLAMAAITTKSIESIPPFYVTVDADVSALLAWRSRWNIDHPDLRLSLNDVFVRAAAMALRDVPALNVRYLNGTVEHRTDADLLLVVAAGGGLSLVPISDPASLSWENYAGEMRRTLKRAGQRQASPSLLEGTPALAVSNLGVFGVKQFTAIIPPASTAILAIGAVREEAVVRNRSVKVGDVCTLTLASDHRVVDGITAAKFLERIQVHLREL